MSGRSYKASPALTSYTASLKRRYEGGGFKRLESTLPTGLAPDERFAGKSSHNLMTDYIAGQLGVNAEHVSQHYVEHNEHIIIIDQYPAFC